ncbi:MAG: glycosyltransferase [Bacteroidia bacterium]
MIPKKNILILTYWDYQDALIQTYTLPYVRIIAEQISSENKLFLVTLDKKKSQKETTRTENNIENISILYQPLGWRGLIMWIRTVFQLILLIREQKISIIHAWCTPAGGMGYILSVLTGTKLIIDSFEPHAEAMVENGSWKKSSIAFKLLFKLEKLQANRALYLISATEEMKKYAKEKYNYQKDNFFVKPACVDLYMFSDKNIKNEKLLNDLNFKNKIVCVYAGKFGGIYLENEVFDFFKVAENYWKNNFRVLLLSSQSKDEINTMIEKSGLQKETIVHQFVPHKQIPNYIGLADFAITPVKSVSTKKYCTPIKDGEYWALGLPIVITKNISEDSDIIRENKIGSVLEELNPEAYLKSIKEIDALLKNNSRNELYNKIRPIAEKYRNFEIAEKVYKQIYGI